MFKGLQPILYHGREVWPLIEGGKGISLTNYASSGAWAAAGGIGTISIVGGDSYDAEGKVIPEIYHGRTRRERHDEMVNYGIVKGAEQVQRAFEVAAGRGAINVNILWEMGGATRILEGVLERTKGLVAGVTCGAGMPYRLGEIAARYRVKYLPIVSSARAFRALWRRAYHKFSDFLGAVVYEDPWLAGGHNGLSNSEDPKVPQTPYPRVKELREAMRTSGLADSVPIVMAGGVWYLRDWNDWIANPELGQIIFQFGTRPLLTKESPVSEQWKERIRNLDKGDVLLHNFSPTGFYSSSVHNKFMQRLIDRSERQIAYATQEDAEYTTRLDVGVAGKNFWVTREGLAQAHRWAQLGYSKALKTPSKTLVFVTEEEGKQIRQDQSECVGCLSACRFSTWRDRDKYTTGLLADPRSFCIHKTLYDISHEGDIEDNLMFSGHNAYFFKHDPFYSNGFTPTVQQLVDRILTGD